MNDDTRQGERALGRSISVLAFGDDADELEMDALDRARKFFGQHVRLEVVREYVVGDVGRGALAEQAGGVPVPRYRQGAVMRLRLSDSARVGPFRLRLSAPLGKGRAYTSESVRLGWLRLSASQPLGGKRRRRG